ncbi:prepilin peptidase [Caviibacterium pharyngocola]|uniref:Prepilin peptidase n=1 Tax=Caviibacterium pharyngocola TaxID=28159 RepID=A0A2M8RVX7_9PAST|nr:A24 family peptidase [Caviibacterium pharyngocola]PJG83048.1 prepilin peptidase [Caviibacterium pharyngocola]
MNFLAALFFGALAGCAVYYYVSGFAQRVSQQVYAGFQECFPHFPLPFNVAQSALISKKCGGFYLYFYGFALLFGLCDLIFIEKSTALWVGCYISLLLTIALIDGLYRLISPALCQQLFALGLLGAFLPTSELELSARLQSAFCGFAAFYGLYYAAKFYYGKEALGRGDYWLMLGLGAFLPAQQLPLLVFIGCMAALGLLCVGGFIGELRRADGYLPFAPFLCFGGLALFLYNLICENNLSFP